MQQKIAARLALRAAEASQPEPTLAEIRAGYDGRGDLYPLPGDATVGQADAGGVPAHWITLPGTAGPRWLRGLPPLLIQVGAAELLLSDSEELATSAAAAGVDVTTAIREGVPHVYQAMADTPEAVEATDQAGGVPARQDRPGRLTWMVDPPRHIRSKSAVLKLVRLSGRGRGALWPARRLARPSWQRIRCCAGASSLTRSAGLPCASVRSTSPGSSAGSTSPTGPAAAREEPPQWQSS